MLHKVCVCCDHKLSKYLTQCPYCGKDTGLPSNLCKVQEDEEYLNERYNKAINCAKESNNIESLEFFENHIHKNKAVSINMRVSALRNLLDRKAYITIHDMLNAGMLIDYDIGGYVDRLVKDAHIFGIDYGKLVFGALNIGNAGLISFGEYCVILKTKNIKDRTSFVEKDSSRYVDSKESSLNIDVPNGSRAFFDTVHKLCVAKHIQSLIKEKSFDTSQIADKILQSTGQKEKDDFVEAQVLKPVTVDDIKMVTYSNKSAVKRPVVKKIVDSENAIISAFLCEMKIPFRKK